MNITRRDFLKYCVASAGALGLGSPDLKRLQAALASDGAPTVVWLHGSGCQGDSVSFLNLVANLAPVGDVTAGSVLINSVNLAYHTVLMTSAGEQAVTMAKQAKRKGGYVLVCEGGVPTIFGGRTCVVWSYNGQRVTYQQAVNEFAADAAAIVCVGTCASYGGIPRAIHPLAALPPSEPSGPTGVLSVKNATGKSVINIPGCPAHPDWIAWAIVQLILGYPVELDPDDRPTALYGNKSLNEDFNIHENCPRNPKRPGGNDFATTFGQDGLCLEELGCRGPWTYSDCPSRKWNNGVNWCVDCNGMCFSCVEPDFPGEDFYS